MVEVLEMVRLKCVELIFLHTLFVSSYFNIIYIVFNRDVDMWDS